MAAFCSTLDSRMVCNLFAIGFYKPYAGLSKPSTAVWQLQASSGNSRDLKSAAISDSLRLLEWHKVVDLVSSFSGTHLGCEAAKAQLSSTIELTYEESKMRLEETSAAMELIKYGSGMLNFSGIDDILVKSAINQAFKGFAVTGLEAIAIVSLIEFTENLQATIGAAAKENAGWHNRFMPLAEMVMNASVCHSLVKMVEQVINEDGSVKDSASYELRQGRERVRIVERKLYQLMERLARNDKNDSLSLEVCNINGRWCIKSMSNQPAKIDGLLLSSGLGTGDLIEPIAALPLNDELQHARALVAEAEEDVLSHLTNKITIELGSLQSLLDMITQLDAVTARAKYCIEYGATYPNFFLPGDIIKPTTDEGVSVGTSNKFTFSHLQREWKLYMPKAYHPLLLQQYRENLENAKKSLANAASDLRRKKMHGKSVMMEDIDSHIEHMKVRVLQLERSPPVPVDFAISAKASVVVITGPNSGGKTISLKTIGLASLMSKAGLYVLASEPARVPWFDAVYADIGDEQSLTQSLSTFSGHLKQISAIRSNSTCHSLVLLDEVGAGTNPLEGAALGMSLLESFAESGSFLTIATTHHGELKTLKYSNHTFENACVEFDEESLKPTYRVLWGIPGRSNAINIAEKLGLSHAILSKAQKVHGKSTGKINEIIMDMENYKQDFERHLQEAEQCLMLSRQLHQDLLMARERVAKHSVIQKKRKAKAISDIAAMAHSVLRTKLQQYRQSALPQSTSQNMATRDSEPPERDLEKMESHNSSLEQTNASAISKLSHEKPFKMPEVGDTVFVPLIGKEAVVLQVLTSKGEMLVQASNIKLRLSLKEIVPGFRKP